MGRTSRPPPVVIPQEKPVTPLPDPDDPLVKQRKRKAVAERGAQRGGRLSTILSDSGLDTLG